MKEQWNISKEKLVTLENGSNSIEEEVIASSSRSGDRCKTLIQYVKFILYVELALFLGWAGYALMQTYRAQPMEVKVVDNIRESHPQLLLELEYLQRTTTVPPREHDGEPSTTTRGITNGGDHEGFEERGVESKDFGSNYPPSKEEPSFEATTGSEAMEGGYTSEDPGFSKASLEDSKEVEPKDSSEEKEEYSSKDVDSQEGSKSEEDLLTWSFPFLGMTHDSNVHRDVDTSSEHRTASSQEEETATPATQDDFHRQLKRLDKLDEAWNQMLQTLILKDDIFRVDSKETDENVDSAPIEEPDNSRSSNDSDEDESLENWWNKMDESTQAEDISAESEDVSKLSTSEKEDVVAELAIRDPFLRRFMDQWKISLSLKNEKHSNVEDDSNVDASEDKGTIEKSTSLESSWHWPVYPSEESESSEEESNLNLNFKDSLTSTESSLERVDENSRSQETVEKNGNNNFRCRTVMDGGILLIHCNDGDVSASKSSSEEVTTSQSTYTDQEFENYSQNSDYNSNSRETVEKNEDDNVICRMIWNGGIKMLKCGNKDSSSSTTSSEEVTNSQSTNTDQELKSYSHNSDYNSRSRETVEKNEDDDLGCRATWNGGFKMIGCGNEGTTSSTTSSGKITTSQSTDTDQKWKSDYYDNDYYSDLYQDYHADYDGYDDDKWIGDLETPGVVTEREEVSTERSYTGEDYQNTMRNSEEESSTSFNEEVSSSTETNHFVIHDPPKETENSDHPIEEVEDDREKNSGDSSLEITSTTSYDQGLLSEEQRTGSDQSWSTTESTLAFEAKDMTESDSQKSADQSDEEDKQSVEREILQPGDHQSMETSDSDEIYAPSYYYPEQNWRFLDSLRRPSCFFTSPQEHTQRMRLKNAMKNKLRHIVHPDNTERKKRYVIQRPWIEGEASDSLRIDNPPKATFHQDVEEHKHQMSSKMRQSFETNVEQMLEMDLDKLFEKMERMSIHIDKLHRRFLRLKKLDDDYISNEMPASVEEK